MNVSLHTCKKNSDKRGHLVQVFRKSFLETYQQKFGQVYYITFHEKDIIRGNHYHKNQEECFCVAAGKVRIVLKDLESEEVIDRIFDADEAIMISIGKNIVHTLKSESDFALVLSFSTKEYEGEDDDKFYCKLL